MADDFIRLITFATDIVQFNVKLGLDWKDAPAETKGFILELQALKTALSASRDYIIISSDFKAAFHGQHSALLSELDGTNKSDTQAMLEECTEELKSLLEKLKNRAKGTRVGLERLKGAIVAKRTRQAVETLNRQCQGLNRLMVIDSLTLGSNIYKEVKESREEQMKWRETQREAQEAIRDGVDKLQMEETSRRDKQRRNEILNWLTTVDYSAEHNDQHTRREEGTGMWLLDSEKYQDWRGSHDAEPQTQNLFCPGIPGAGKTVLCSMVVEDIQKRVKNDPNSALVYIYFNYQLKTEQTFEQLQLSILRQLAQSSPKIPEALISLYRKQHMKKPSAEQVAQTIENIALTCEEVFLIIDALDECQEEKQCRLKFLKYIFQLQQAVPQTKTFATSRFIPEICNFFEECPTIEITASTEDVRKVLDARIAELPGFVQQNVELQEAIKSTIAEAVDGM